MLQWDEVLCVCVEGGMLQWDEVQCVCVEGACYSGMRYCVCVWRGHATVG